MLVLICMTTTNEDIGRSIGSTSARGNFAKKWRSRGTSSFGLWAAGFTALLTSCSNSEKGNDAGTLSYAEFINSASQEETGEFIADGDTLFVDEQELREFYESNVAKTPSGPKVDALIIMNVKGVDGKWPPSRQENLTYCVSTSFGRNYDAVVKAMKEATSAWSAVAKVRFVHLDAQDGACNPRNNEVVFDVNPVNAKGAYLARAFFPTTPRQSRNVKIDGSSFAVTGKLTLTGILRHELGHAIGFRHEHTRPEVGGKCYEDRNWRVLTSYDPASVMHYPQCNGTGDFSLELSSLDAEGARRAYPF